MGRPKGSKTKPPETQTLDKQITITYRNNMGQPPDVCITYKNVAGYVEASMLLRLIDKDARRYQARGVPLGESLKPRPPVESGHISEDTT